MSVRGACEEANAAGRPACVVGIGRTWRGDDAVGWLAVRRAGRAIPPDVKVVLSDGDPVALLDAWDGCATAIVVDAARLDAAPGTVLRFDASSEPLAARPHGASSHGVGLHDAIETARALGRLPPTTIVLAIVAGRFDAGRFPTAAARRGARTAAEAVAAEISARLRRG